MYTGCPAVKQDFCDNSEHYCRRRYLGYRTKQRVSFLHYWRCLQAPHATSESFEYLEMSLKKKPLFILSDLNYLTKRSAKLVKIIKKNRLKQITNKPTRITENTLSLLDVIITDRSDSCSVLLSSRAMLLSMDSPA